MRRTSFELGEFIRTFRAGWWRESFSEMFMFEFIVTTIWKLSLLFRRALGFVSRNCLTKQANKAGARRKESLHV